VAWTGDSLKQNFPIPSNQLTVSLFREAYPEALVKALEDEGVTVNLKAVDSFPHRLLSQKI
jgi:hypothetical protein